MLRGDPVIIEPVRVYGSEYRHDIGWTWREAQVLAPSWYRVYRKAFESAACLGTFSLVLVEVYLLLSQSFLDTGLVLLVIWVAWLEVNWWFIQRFSASGDRAQGQTEVVMIDRAELQHNA